MISFPHGTAYLHMQYFYCLTLGAEFEYQLESAWIFFNFLTNFDKLF
jgi:hypothetical protein